LTKVAALLLIFSTLGRMTLDKGLEDKELRILDDPKYRQIRHSFIVSPVPHMMPPLLRPGDKSRSFLFAVETTGLISGLYVF